nr:hypothetical protein [uncultured Undibacterium sp.]
MQALSRVRETASIVDNRNTFLVQSAISAVQTMLLTVHRLVLETALALRYSASVAEAVTLSDGKLGTRLT